MTKSKIIASAGNCYCHEASAAQAGISISGGIAGWFITGDSMTVSDSGTQNQLTLLIHTLDNGMGISVTQTLVKLVPHRGYHVDC